jgi:hypothetical protein
MEGKGKKLQINGFVKLTDRKNRWLDENWKILGTFVRDTESVMGPTFEVDDAHPLEYPIYRITIKETSIGIPNVIQININSEIKSGPILLPYVDIEVEHIMTTTKSIHNTTLTVESIHNMEEFKKQLLHIIEKVTTL